MLQCFWRPLRGALVFQPSHYCMTLAEQRVRNKPDQRNVWLGSRTISSFSGNARLPSQTSLCARLLASGLQGAGLQKHVRCTKQHHVHGCIGNYLHAHLLAASLAARGAQDGHPPSAALIKHTYSIPTDASALEPARNDSRVRLGAKAIRRSLSEHGPSSLLAPHTRVYTHVKLCIMQKCKITRGC